MKGAGSMGDIFQASYDRIADTLYIGTGEAASSAVEDEFGIWRLAADGRLVGVTIMDFQEIWGSERDNLMREVAGRLNLPSGSTQALFDKGLAVSSAS